MALKVALDHPVFLLKSKVQEASQSLFDTFGFNYFQYLRCFADGSISELHCVRKDGISNRYKA